MGFCFSEAKESFSEKFKKNKKVKESKNLLSPHLGDSQTRGV